MTKQDLVDITNTFFREKGPSRRNMERYRVACTKTEEYFRKKGINPTPIQLLERMNKIYAILGNRKK